MMDIVILLFITVIAVVMGYFLGRLSMKRDIIEKTIDKNPEKNYDEVVEAATAKLQRAKDRRKHSVGHLGDG